MYLGKDKHLYCVLCGAAGRKFDSDAIHQLESTKQQTRGNNLYSVLSIE